MRGSKKSKSNPTRRCKICGEKIFNKTKRAIYCKKHDKDVWDINNRMKNLAWQLGNKYPQYNIEHTIEISMKRQV